MELLAPAGSFAAFEAALAEGADAVYLGAPDLNARALARDFTFDEIGAMIQYAHHEGVRVYIAMNSLVKEADIPLALECLTHFAAYHADALIIQDIGLLRLATANFPNLRLHASTLMSVHNSLAVNKLIELGFKRVVLPRELTIEEIGTIFLQTGAELEVFVHGAMCFSYSGLCLFSSLHGGKSSLRGQCVQPCRRRYSWLKKKSLRGNRQITGKGGGYLFSMNDLSAVELLPELARAGVGSLKIEGRLKSAEYVRKTVRAYRLILDNLGKTGPEMQKIQGEARHLLDEAMGRRRSTGFLLSSRPQEAVTPHFSGNVGMMVGRVNTQQTKAVSRGGPVTELTVSLRQPVLIGDRLRLHSEQTGERTSFTLHSMWIGRKKVQEGKIGQTVRLEYRQQLSERPMKNFSGTLFKVDIGSGRQNEKKIREKVMKQIPKNPVPSRERIAALINSHSVGAISTGNASPAGRIVPTHGAGQRAKGKLQWWVKVRGFSDMQFRLPVVPARYVLPMTEENVELGLRYFYKNYDRIIWSLPPVILEDRLAWYIKAGSSLMQKQYVQFQVGHISQLSLFTGQGENRPPLRLYGDYSINALNSLSLEQLRQTGLSGTLFSIETDRENLAEALCDFRRNRQDFHVGMYVYGRPPLFTSRLDDARFDYGKRFVSPKGEEYTLSRENDMTMARSVEPFSLLAEWQNLVRLDVDYLFIDLSTGNMKRNVTEFITRYHKKGEHPSSMSGNYFDKLA